MFSDLMRDASPEPGDQGPAVKAWQDYLAAEGFRLGQDGIFGPETERITRLWQFLEHGREAVGADICTTLMLAEDVEPSADDIHDAAEFAARLPPDLIASDATADALQALFAMRAKQRRIGFADFAELTAWVAVFLLAQGISETTSNRGPWVDVLVSLGGGNPEDAAPWCARFVCACRRIALWLWSLDGEEPRTYPQTGSASRIWVTTPPPHRMERSEAAWLESTIGAAFVRTRTSAPASDREVVLSGDLMKGHTGIVVDLASDGFVCVAGNSSGSGHSAGSGSVAVEIIAPTSGHALRAWDRLVGVCWTWPKVSTT